MLTHAARAAAEQLNFHTLRASPNQVLTHAARAAAKQLNKHLFLATNMCVRARATARGGATEFMHLRRDRFRTFRRPSRGRLGIRDIRGIELVQ